MHARILLFLFLITPIFSFANNLKTVSIKKVTDKITVDGNIDQVWQQADSVINFVQFQPYNGKEPTYKTIAKVLTTDDALYCLIVCEQDASDIQNNAGLLDSHGGDIVSIMLDTFGDKRTAYKFAVTAAGVRADCRLLDDARNRDYSWDGVWFASSTIYDWGYVVEMEIPYRSFQYDENLTEWGLDFDRWIPARTEDIYWCAYEENEGQRISKFGKLKFENFRPSVKGLNFEIYPVGIAKATYLHEGKYNIDPNAGLDIFYNPSQQLTFQLTANPDFAQIEADPYEFNISRYETYFSERRPFFTEGSEVFNPSGRERNSGFYRPLELFYSRRIGKKLDDGSEVPLYVGTRAFGRYGDWEYGGSIAAIGAKDYIDYDGNNSAEDHATFGSARIKKQIFDNSSIGLLYVGKHSKNDYNGVLDIDGALRGSDWQLAYQLARSFRNSNGDYAGSAGLRWFTDKWITGVRGNYIGENFALSQVGYVPWLGTWELTAISGPRWYYEQGTVTSILLYGIGSLNYEKADSYIDKAIGVGFNMQFRSNWGFEINLTGGKSLDAEKKYDSQQLSYSSWFNISPKWNANINGNIGKTYNFRRDYLAFYTFTGASANWQILNTLNIGSSIGFFIEGNPNNNIEDLVTNVRPYFSFTPFNDINIRTYVDNIYIRSSDRLERVLLGLLVSYNFLPKSWIYFAFNSLHGSNDYDNFGNIIPSDYHITDRTGVLKVKYLYYF